MKISKVEISVCHINGGMSGSVTKHPRGITHEVRGKITFSDLEMAKNICKYDAPRLTLQIGDKEYKLRGTGLPRLNCGEEVILHLDSNDVVAFQVIVSDETIFRGLLPFEEFRHGARRYHFLD